MRLTTASPKTTRSSQPNKAARWLPTQQKINTNNNQPNPEKKNEKLSKFVFN